MQSVTTAKLNIWNSALGIGMHMAGFVPASSCAPELLRCVAFLTSKPKPKAALPLPLLLPFSLPVVQSTTTTSSSSCTTTTRSSSSSRRRKLRRSLCCSCSMAYDRELAIAVKATSLAARLCQSVQKGLLQTDAKDKLDSSPVTVADYGSQALISFVLNKELPAGTFSLVAEEDAEDLQKEDAYDMLERITSLVNGTLTVDGTYSVTPLTSREVINAIDKGKSEGGPHGQHWVLDPIDGTKGFLRGDQYAIALALLDEGEVKLGVLACPNLPWTSLSVNPNPSNDKIGCLFSAVRGSGTTVQLLDGKPTPTKVYVTTTDSSEEASFFESFESAHSMHDLSARIAKIMGVKKSPIRIDSQAKYGALARGDGAIYLRFPRPGYREKIWDHAAGSVVIQEAGGLVVDASGNPLDFSKGRFLDVDTGIIATNKTLMPLLLKAVQKALANDASSPQGSSKGSR